MCADFFKIIINCQYVNCAFQSIYVHVRDPGFTENLMILKCNCIREEEFPNKMNIWLRNMGFLNARQLKKILHHLN